MEIQVMEITNGRYEIRKILETFDFFFWNLEFGFFFDIHFKNTSTVICLGFKVPSESFFFSRISKKSYFLTYISGLEKKKIESKGVNKWVRHPVYTGYLIA